MYQQLTQFMPLEFHFKMPSVKNREGGLNCSQVVLASEAQNKIFMNCRRRHNTAFKRPFRKKSVCKAKKLIFERCLSLREFERREI